MDDNQNQIPIEVIKTPPPVSSYFKTLSAVLGVFVLVAGLGIAVRLSQQKQETRTKASVDLVDLSLSPDQTQVGPNQEINIAVGMNTHNYKVSAVDLRIAYDSTIFDYVSFTKTNILPTVLTTATGVNGLLSTVLGSDASNPQMGDVVIGNLVLKSKSNAAGSGIVHIDPSTQVAGIDPEGNAVATSLLGDIGEISINVSPPASPTPVASPISSPVASPVASPTTLPVKRPGDANGDNKTDGLDYVVWISNFGKTTANKNAEGDFNEDGRVDGIDYSIWLLNYL